MGNVICERDPFLYVEKLNLIDFGFYKENDDYAYAFTFIYDNNTKKVRANLVQEWLDGIFDDKNIYAIRYPVNQRQFDLLENIFNGKVLCYDKLDFYNELVSEIEDKIKDYFKDK